jgi:hypothetical protein
MDTIDVTSPEFSLGGFSELNDIISDTITLDNVSSDYTMYMYIGVLILSGIIFYFIYKFYINKEKRVTFQDKLDECYGDTCKI